MPSLMQNMFLHLENFLNVSKLLKTAQVIQESMLSALVSFFACSYQLLMKTDANSGLL